MVLRFLPEFVKGCLMPAHIAMTVGMAQGSAGRRRTSPEGGNRGAKAGWYSLPECYGDLNDRGGVEASNEPAVFTLKPTPIAFRK